jgi:lipoprotein-anchoring transpeptidase ErfK/SrfK
MWGRLGRRAAKTAFALVLAAATVGAAAPSAGRPPLLIEPGVSVAGLPVGGWDSETARSQIRDAAARPVLISYGGRTLTVEVERLGATFAIDDAVSVALRAASGSAVALTPTTDTEAVRATVEKLARRFYVAPVDAKLVGLDGLRPQISSERSGLAVRAHAMEIELRRALRSTEREAIPLLTRPLRPKVTRRDFGAVIVIARGSNELRLYDAGRLRRSFRVATGSARYPTPSGTWSVVTKQRYPWWYPPASDWAKGLKPVPPGPGNPLGTRWMGLSAAAVGIHGTPDPASIGYSASHGCIRMHVPEAEWLFERVEVGTPVVIV